MANWRNPAGPRRRLSDQLDDEIQHVEATVAGVSTAEVLWGGPRGNGLVHIVTQLSETVDKLAETVGALGAKVSGSEGVEAKLNMLQGEVESVGQSVDGVKSELNSKWQQGIGMVRWVLGAAWAIFIGLVCFVAKYVWDSAVTSGGHH